MNDVRRLQQAVRDQYGLASEHLESLPVRVQVAGKTVWDGRVEVFRVRGHSSVTTAYAWSDDGDGGQTHHVILGVAPINSAVDAVKAAVMARSQPVAEPNAELPTI